MRHPLKLLLLIVILATSCQKEELSTNHDEVFYVRTHGADMPVYLHGNTASGAIVILLHGGPGDSGLGYRTGEYYKLLEKEFGVAYWDQRGQGGSHGHYSVDDVTIARMVEDLHAVVRVLKYRFGEDYSLFIMGHSWGGTLGTAYMLHQDYQHEVKGWIEVDGAHDIPLLNKEAIKMFISIGTSEIQQGNHVSKWTEIVNFALSVDTNNISFDEGDQINEYAFQAEELLDKVYPIPYSDISGFSNAFLQPTNPLTSSLAAINTDNLLYEEVETTSYTDELNSITIPCLFLWGKYDFVVPPYLGQSAFDRVSSTDKKLVLFEHSGHSPMDNEPEAFADEMITFVNGHK